MAAKADRMRWIAAAFVAVCTGLVVADVPTTFPAAYDVKQRLVTTFTLTRAGRSYTLTRRMSVLGSVVLDNASALHFEPAYADGNASATYVQHGANKIEFDYDDDSLGLLHDYYLDELVRGGALHSSDDFRLTFGDGKFVFRRGVSKLRGHQPLRFTARRNGRLVLRGRAMLSWSGSQD